MMKRKVSVYTIVLTALFTALCLIGATISIPIPLGIGMAKLHFGNVFMLIAALLLGSVKGGLASGVGMALSDIFSGTFAVYAPGTLIGKFISAFICGKIVYAKGRRAGNMKWNIIGVLAGILTNVILSSINSFAVNMLVNEGQFMPSLLSAFGNLGIGCLNAVVASIVALTLGVALVKIMKKTNIFYKI